MRQMMGLCLVLVALLGWWAGGALPAVADSRVVFAVAAPAGGVRQDGGRPVPDVVGYLTRPMGRGPFPAVVVLHSCLGLRADRQAIGDRLASWGYVALLVDDFSTRGLRDTCTVDFPEGLADAFGALAFVAGLPDVDRGRIAALGFSQGADTALKIAASPAGAAFALPAGLRFRAAAAFYPPCEDLLGVRLDLPTLILVGAADTVTPAAQCRQLLVGQGANVKLVVYPGAGHVFDDPAFVGGKRLMGMWLQFDRRAAAQSTTALRAFLAAALRH